MSGHGYYGLMTGSPPNSSSTPPVVATNLRKEYGDVVAVEESSFSVSEGSILGIIGPNGSGKTTTLKMLAGLIEPTGGTAQVTGYDCQDAEMRQYLGFLPEESPLYEDMTGVDYLRFFAKLYDVPSDVAEERIHEFLDRLDLDKRDTKIGNMSKGMTRKVAIARSLVNDPDVLIYDEPASGLDPLSTRYIIEFIKELRAEGKTIVISNHNLYHVADICDEVLMMLDGTIVANGTLDAIQREHGTTTYTVYTTVPVDGAEPADEDDLYVSVVQSMDEVNTLYQQAEANDGEVADVKTEESSLEDIFVELAGDA